MPNDATLQSLVTEELEWEPRVDPAHIGVVAKNGVVTLSGFVDSYAAKAAAEQAARRVKGVTAIAEEIEVRLPNAHKHADDEIAERAVRMLQWDIGVPHDRIEVKVEHGVVTLQGEVPHHFQRTTAESDIRRLGGVRNVINLIRVVPPAMPAADVDVVQQRIEGALRRNAEIEASRIRVTIDGRRAILKGYVRSWPERAAAEAAVWAAPGVNEVRNELYIQS